MAEISQNNADQGIVGAPALGSDCTPTTYTCHQCNCTSNYSDGFLKEKTRKSHLNKYTCVTCAAFENKKQTQKWGWFELLVGLIFFTFVMRTDNFSQVISFLISWFFLLHLAIFVHEYGHYIASRLLGVKVRLMTLGAGPVVKVFRLKQLFLVLSLLPLSGSVHSDFKSKANIRKKFFLIVLAGPFSNLLMAGSTAITFIHFEQIFPSVVSDLMVSWIVANTIMGISNLIPFRAFNKFGVCLSDGAQLLKIPTWTEGEINKLIWANQGSFAQMEFEYGDKGIARAIAIEAIESGQDMQLHSGLLSVSSRTRDDFELAIKINRQALENIHHENEFTAMVRSNLAYTLFRHGNPSFLPEADKQSLKAMDTLPMLSLIHI